MGIRTDTATSSEVGDVGIIIRSYNAVLGGVAQTTPAFSILCNKLEISVPAAVGSQLLPGDYVNMQVTRRPGHHESSGSLRALFLPHFNAEVLSFFRLKSTYFLRLVLILTRRMRMRLRR